MLTKIIEATNEEQNWGKFCLGRFSKDEWEVLSQVDHRSVLGGRGWSRGCLLVLDLQTGEGCVFEPHGLASADLNKHRIWVCPLFEPFLNWLYKQKTETLNDFESLPAMVNFTLEEAQFEFRGHRRPGPDLTDVAVNAHGMGQRDVLDRLKKWGQWVRKQNRPFAVDPHLLLSKIESGDWAKDLIPVTEGDNDGEQEMADR